MPDQTVTVDTADYVKVHGYQPQDGPAGHVLAQWVFHRVPGDPDAPPPAPPIQWVQAQSYDLAVHCLPPGRWAPMCCTIFPE